MSRKPSALSTAFHKGETLLKVQKKNPPPHSAILTRRESRIQTLMEKYHLTYNLSARVASGLLTLGKARRKQANQAYLLERQKKKQQKLPPEKARLREEQRRKARERGVAYSGEAGERLLKKIKAERETARELAAEYKIPQFLSFRVATGRLTLERAIAEAKKRRLLRRSCPYLARGSRWTKYPRQSSRSVSKPS